MEPKLCIYFCSSLLPEVSHLLQDGNYPDVTLKGYPANCSSGYVSNEMVLEMVAKNLNSFSKIIVVTSACRGNKNIKQNIHSKIEIIQLEQCFEIFYNLPSIYHFIKQGNYLVTNGWLKNYKQHIREWGFDESSAKIFFGESIQKILLLETGLPGDYHSGLEALSKYMGVPYDILPVGDSHLQLFIDALIFKWRAEEERASFNNRIAKITRESADYSVLFSQLKKLIDLTDENLIEKEMANLLDVLFMPQQICFQKFYKEETNDVICYKEAKNPSVINDDNSFTIDIEHHSELMGRFQVSGVQFPQHRSQYSSMSQVISQIGGLSIENARRYSELELANQAIAVSQKRFKAVMEQSPAVIEMYDLDGLQRSVNHAYEKLWGFRASDTLNQFNILKSEEVKRSGLINYVMRAYQGESVKVPEYQFDSTGKTEGKGKGRKRWLSTSIYPLKDSKNQVQNIIVTHEDITEQKETALLLADRNQKFKQLSQSATEMLSLNTEEDIYRFLSNALHQQYPDAIILFVTIDEEEQTSELYKIQGISTGFLEKANKLAGFKILKRKYKITPTHLKLFKSGEFYHFTKGLAEFSGGEFPEIAARILEKLIGIHHIYTIGINKEDKLFAAVHLFNRNKKPISDSEYIELFIKQAAIVIEKKQAEIQLRKSESELKELNAQKDKFFSIIGHDLKSPFNSIMGFSELLEEQISEKNYDNIDKYAKIIGQSSQRAVDLLMNLLEWSRAHTGKMEFSPENFELVHFINEITLLHHNIAAQKLITLKKDLPPKLTVFADKQMISTVMRNLISNAIKFTRQGGEITILAEKRAKEIFVSVNDNGIGIAPDRIEKLFRIDESDSTPGTNNEKGTGLGLILCKEFVEKHGGKIWVESVQNEGSEFCFTIPSVR
jgi:PAS domain S-box-containing protein